MGLSAWWWWLMAMEEWWDYLSSLCLALSWAFALINSFWLHRKGKYCFIPVFVCEQMGAQKRGQSCSLVLRILSNPNTKKLLKADATSQLPSGKVNEVWDFPIWSHSSPSSSLWRAHLLLSWDVVARNHEVTEENLWSGRGRKSHSRMQRMQWSKKQ